MSDLYPILMIPEFSPRPWGTRDLRPIYTRVVGKEPIGEAWLTGDECRVANGPFSGASLSDLCRRFGRELVGQAAPQPDRFPLLTKFLFPHDKLSVQVHPDDEGARELGQPCGKTECWYVAKCLPGAQVGLGLKPGVGKPEFEAAILANRAENLLNWVDLNPGDLIYVDAGTVHSIGPGSILIETQQNSDTTFRLYDFGRGRELHIEQGLRAMRESTNAGKVSSRMIGGHDLLVASPCFVVEHFALTEPLTLAVAPGRTSAQVLVAVEGSAVVEWEGGQPVSFNRGEAVVIPASIEQVGLRPQWAVEFLRMRVPGEPVPSPVVEKLTEAVRTPE
ncbi:MAG: type I phosphomannose isomerase catalytic subunit [Candidatus Korobacteraceae bacterium]|jgi:mannose-6-phosphate isomerase